MCLRGRRRWRKYQRRICSRRKLTKCSSMVQHVAGNSCSTIFHSSWLDQRSQRECNCQRFLQFIHWRCLYWQNHAVRHCICSFERGLHVHNLRKNFSISWAEQSIIGIHGLPQLAMYWDSDKFFGVESFKEMIPKHCFMTLGKYLHLADLTVEDQSLPTYNMLGAEVCRSIHSL